MALAANRSELVEFDDRPMSSRQRFAAILVALGEFIDGYDLLVMGAALIFLRPQFHLTAEQIGLLGAASFLGSIVGLLVFGDLSDRLGRRAIFVANLIFFVVFSILCGFITSVPQLFIARFLVGVGVGMDIPTSTAYLAEIAPRRQRGALLGALPQIMWILGAMASTLVALPLDAFFGPTAWRWMFGLAALPAFLVLLGRQTLPESPRWLLAQGRVDEAREALRSFGVEPGVLNAEKSTGSYAALLRPPFLRRALWVGGVFFLNCLSGPIATIATPFVLHTVGALSIKATLWFSVLIWITSLVGAVASFMLIDRIGRRRLAMISLIPSGICAILMGVYGAHDATLLVVFFFAFSFFNWLGAPSLQWAWSSELFPTELRGRSQGFCNSLCRLAISINIFLVPVALVGIGFTTFLVLLSIPLFAYAAIVASVDIFESTGQHLETLAAE